LRPPKIKRDSLKIKGNSPKLRRNSLKIKGTSPKLKRNSLQLKGTSPKLKEHQLKLETVLKGILANSQADVFNTTQTLHEITSTRLSFAHFVDDLESMRNFNAHIDIQISDLTKEFKIIQRPDWREIKLGEGQLWLRPPKFKRDSLKIKGNSPKLRRNSLKIKGTSPKLKRNNLQLKGTSPKLKEHQLKLETVLKGILANSQADVFNTMPTLHEITSTRLSFAHFVDDLESMRNFNAHIDIQISDLTKEFKITERPGRRRTRAGRHWILFPEQLFSKLGQEVDTASEQVDTGPCSQNILLASTPMPPTSTATLNDHIYCRQVHAVNVHLPGRQQVNGHPWPPTPTEQQQVAAISETFQPASLVPLLSTLVVVVAQVLQKAPPLLAELEQQVQPLHLQVVLQLEVPAPADPSLPEYPSDDTDLNGTTQVPGQSPELTAWLTKNLGHPTGEVTTVGVVLLATYTEPRARHTQVT
ncbi:hypothetical protein Taro_010411, partial [Colocasia esculenta]|nr:hypothetical protein [Colocasia esculenta]